MKSLWQAFIDRFWGLVGGVSVRTKILGIVISGTLLLSLGLVVQIRSAVMHIMEQELHAHAVSIGRDLAARATDLILVNDLYALRQLLIETQANNSDVRYAFLTDHHGRVLAHSFGSGFPVGLRDANRADAEEYQHTALIQTDEGLVWDVAVPILNGEGGTARVGVSQKRVSQTLLDLTSQVILTTVIALALGLLAAGLLTFVLTRPILDLVHATRQIGQGDFSQRVRRWADDEIGELAGAFNQMAVELEQADGVRREREALRRQLLDGVIAAQEDERRRIARELHDSTSQSLTSLMVGLRNLDTLCGNDFGDVESGPIGSGHLESVHLQARDLRDLAGRVLEDVHNLAVQLRPSVLDDLGLPDALEHLVQEWQTRYRIRTDLVVHLGERRLPDGVETAVYRIVQEALTNIARHAAAQSVSILVERRLNEIVSVIEDDGVGFDSEKTSQNGGLGLAGVRERSELLGGSLTIESSRGRGTSLYIRIPLNPNGEGNHEQFCDPNPVG